MNFHSYSQAAARTINPEQSDRDNLANFGLGLAGEAGEVCDLIKKHLYHRVALTDEEHNKLQKELGDVLWYWSAIIRVMGYDPEWIAQLNIDKLRHRHPEGFDPSYHSQVQSPDTTLEEFHKAFGEGEGLEVWHKGKELGLCHVTGIERNRRGLKEWTEVHVRRLGLKPSEKLKEHIVIVGWERELELGKDHG